MSELYVIRNQLGHYWAKSKTWIDGTEPKAAMVLKHEDEAINTLFELSSKDIELRGEMLPVTLSDKGIPNIEPSEHLLPKETKATLDDPLAEVSPEESVAENVEETEADAPEESATALES